MPLGVGISYLPLTPDVRVGSYSFFEYMYVYVRTLESRDNEIMHYSCTLIFHIERCICNASILHHRGDELRSLLCAVLLLFEGVCYIYICIMLRDAMI